MIDLSYQTEPFAICYHSQKPMFSTKKPRHSVTLWYRATTRGKNRLYPPSKIVQIRGLSVRSRAIVNKAMESKKNLGQSRKKITMGGRGYCHVSSSRTLIKPEGLSKTATISKRLLRDFERNNFKE